jgi:hypothetical protein
MEREPSFPPDTAPIPAKEMAQSLQEQLGQKVVAYVAGITDPKLINRWAAGENKPTEMALFRLRSAFEIVQVLSSVYDTDTAKAWLFGTNSRLGDEAPAYLIRHAQSWEDLKEIAPTARAFAAGAS